MYVAVQHTISDPATFWNAADPTQLPAELKLHHTFPTNDGKRAVCIWEGESVNAVRNFLESLVGRASRNEYFEVENKEGVMMPSSMQRAQARA